MQDRDAREIQALARIVRSAGMPASEQTQTTSYPVFLDVRGRRCVVIGGGPLAEEKVAGLLGAGARVTVIARELTDRLEELARAAGIDWLPRSYQEGDLGGAFVAIAAGENHAVNQRIWEEAERRDIPLNAVDDLRHCHFLAPAIHRVGDVTVAISTAGKAPALAVRLRQQLAELVRPEHGLLADLLGSLRREVTASVPDFAARKQLWYRMVDSDALTLLRDGNVDAARERVYELLAGAAPGRET